VNVALWEWPPLSDCLGLAALLLLAVPALSAAAAADSRHRFLQLQLGDNVDPKLRASKERLDKKLGLLRDWSPWHSTCLYVGYTCALLPYLVKLV
jgi:hypothetical protein